MTREPAAIIEYDLASVKREIASAWKDYQKTEKYGLKFGETCYEWQQKLRTKGGEGNKGKGIVPMLESLNIPTSTAYWWIDRYKEAEGITPAKSKYISANSREFKNGFANGSPSKSQEAIAAHEDVAANLQKLFDDLDITVARSKEMNRFHVTLRNLTEDQVRSIRKGKLNAAA